MPRLINKHVSEIGIGPDAIVYRGSNSKNKIVISEIVYGAGEVQEKELQIDESFTIASSANKNTWVNFDGVHDAELMKRLSNDLGIEEMIFSDVVNTHTRPKAEEYDNCIYLNIKMIQQSKIDTRVRLENVSMILCDNYLLTFQEVSGDVFEPVRDRIRKHRHRITNNKVDYLLFAVLDVIIDNYMFILTNLGEKIENLEEQLIDNSDGNITDKINHLKKELTFLRKSIFPAREMINNLTKLESGLIKKKNLVHFNELSNNLNQVIDTCDSYREMLTDQLNIYHTILSTSLNDTMQFLTVFSVIFIPLTFIAGIYGTNFDNIPELHYKNAYFFMLGLMLLITVGMLWYFKRKRWL